MLAWVGGFTKIKFHETIHSPLRKKKISLLIVFCVFLRIPDMGWVARQTLYVHGKVFSTEKN